MIAARTAKLALLFLLVAVAIQIQPAWAHGGPVGACPAPFDVVSQLENIEITFSEPIDETGARTISLFADEGRSEIELGPTTLDDPTTLVAAIPPSLEPGIYRIRFDAFALDGESYDGGYPFTYDPTAEESRNCAEQNGGTSVITWLIGGTCVLLLAWLGAWLKKGDNEST